MNFVCFRIFLPVVLAGALLLACPGKARGQRLAVIVNPANPIARADARLLASIYSMNTQYWKDGTRIAMFNLQGDEKMSEQFHGFIGRTPLELRKIWLRIQLSGEGKSPTAVYSQADMISRVTRQSGAIGFVGEDAVTPDVKVIAWIE